MRDMFLPLSGNLILRLTNVNLEDETTATVHFSIRKTDPAAPDGNMSDVTIGVETDLGATDDNRPDYQRHVDLAASRLIGQLRLLIDNLTELRSE